MESHPRLGREHSVLLPPEVPSPDPVRGDSDLVAIHGLGKIAAVVMSGNMKIENYLTNLKHFNGLWKGPKMDLESVGKLYPSSHPPDFAPLEVSEMKRALSGLEGKNPATVLAAADLGVPVDTKDLQGDADSQKTMPKRKAGPSLATKFKLKR